MRLDKYLKVSRLIKRRTVAKVLADKEVFLVNGKTAKPATNVKVGDIIDLYLGSHHYRVCVKEIRECAKIEQTASMYEMLLTETIEGGTK